MLFCPSRSEGCFSAGDGQPQPLKIDSVTPAQSRMSNPPKTVARVKARRAPKSFRGRYAAGTYRESGNVSDPQRRLQRRFRARSQDPAGRLVNKQTRELRFRARGAGFDEKGLSRDLCKNCYTAGWFACAAS